MNTKFNHEKFLKENFQNFNTEKYKNLFSKILEKRTISDNLSKKELPKISEFENIQCEKYSFIDYYVFLRCGIEKDELIKQIKVKLNSKDYCIDINYCFLNCGDFYVVVVLDNELINIENYIQNLRKKFINHQYNFKKFSEENLLDVYEFIRNLNLNYCLILYRNREIFFIKQNISKKKTEKKFKINNVVSVVEPSNNVNFFTKRTDSVESVYSEENISSEILVTSVNFKTIEETNILINIRKADAYCLKENKKIRIPKLILKENIVFCEKNKFSISKYSSYFEFDFYLFLQEIFDDQLQKIIEFEKTDTIQETETKLRNKKYTNKNYDQPYILCFFPEKSFAKIVKIMLTQNRDYFFKYLFLNNQDNFERKMLKKTIYNVEIFHDDCLEINRILNHTWCKFYENKNEINFEEWLKILIKKNPTYSSKFIMQYVYDKT